MTEVILHIYDVTNSGNEKTNSTIVQINKIFKDGIGLGGIFHSAVQVYGDDEWSFGFCEQGTGVFSCPPGKNPMYTYREHIVLGKTNCSIFKVNQILRELSREWPGYTYDLLSKNCNHFCDEFCERLGVPKLPGWVNRFAHAGDAAVEIAGNTAQRFRQAKTEIVSASKVAYRFFMGVANNAVAPESPANSNRGSPRFQATWFKNLISNGNTPSGSSVIGNKDEDSRRLEHQAEEAVPIQQNSLQDDGIPTQQSHNNAKSPAQQNSRHDSKIETALIQRSPVEHAGSYSQLLLAQVNLSQALGTKRRFTPRLCCRWGIATLPLTQ
ncbi:PPPDE peptidase domain, partial [Dillenia turbinata]